MLILIDTNILLRIAEPSHSQHAAAVEAIRMIRVLAHRPVIVPQVIYEFWAVATRPVEANGLGVDVAEAQKKLDSLFPLFRILRDERTIFELWQQVVFDHNVKGKQVHDARLVAAMLRHGISHLLTFNATHFVRYGEIVVVEPEQAGALTPAT